MMRARDVYRQPRCQLGKVRFTSEAQALRALAKFKNLAAQGEGYAPQRVYGCSVCQGWHLTSREDNQQP